MPRDVTILDKEIISIELKIEEEQVIINCVEKDPLGRYYSTETYVLWATLPELGQIRSVDSNGDVILDGEGEPVMIDDTYPETWSAIPGAILPKFVDIITMAESFVASQA